MEAGVIHDARLSVELENTMDLRKLSCREGFRMVTHNGVGVIVDIKDEEASNSREAWFD